MFHRDLFCTVLRDFQNKNRCQNSFLIKWRPAAFNIFKKVSKNIAKIIVISPNLRAWEFCVNAQFPRSFWRFPQNLHTRKLVKISIFSAVKSIFLGMMIKFSIHFFQRTSTGDYFK